MNTQDQCNNSTDDIASILPLVDAVVASLERRLPLHVSRDDLASAGKLALVEALRRFDGPENEVRAYCFTRVRGAVFDELRRLDPLSRRTRAQVSLVQKAASDLEAALGRAPTSNEVAKATGMRLEKLTQLQRISTATALRSLDEENQEGEPLHQIPDLQGTSPVDATVYDEMSESVHDALARLPENQAYVLRRYHYEDATLEEIAGELGISRERVRQLRIAAEKKLKADVMILSAWSSIATAA